MKTNSNHFSRRNFLRSTALIPALVAAQNLGGLASKTLAADGVGAPGTAKKYPLGLELYSVRGELARDLPNTLKTVAKAGYELVEFYAPYYDWSIPYAKEVRSLVDDLGLKCRTTHNHIMALTAGETMAKAIELNQILGTRIIVLASAGNVQGLEGWKKLAGQLTDAVEKLKPHGLTAGYHNHQAEWKTLEGSTRIMDVIAANTPKEFVLQLDVGTCMEAGQDPVAWVKANPGRIRSMHLKDWSKDQGYKVLFGEGTTPWRDLITAAESVGGIEYYLLEQEGSRYSEFETVQHCLENWKNFRKTLG